MNLAKMRILTEAPNDDVFDIDKEVDAQLKRVENRIARKNNANNPPPSEEQPNDNQMQDQNEEQPQDEQQPQEEPAAEDDMNQENDLDQQPSEDDGENADGQPQDTSSYKKLTNIAHKAVNQTNTKYKNELKKTGVMLEVEKHSDRDVIIYYYTEVFE